MITALALLGTASAADVDLFRPSGSLSSGLGTLQGESPHVLGEGLGLGIYGSFAQNLAVQRVGDRRTPLVAASLPISVYGGWTLEDKGVRIEAFVPVYASVVAPGLGYDGAAFGDLRLQGNIALYQKDDVLAVGIVPRLQLPTGNRGAGTRGGAQVGFTGTIGGELPEGFSWLGNAGVTLSGSDTVFDKGLGSSVDLLAGLSYRIKDGIRVGAEVDTVFGLVQSPQGRNTTGTWHGFAQARTADGIGLTVGAGSGLVSGLGTPEYRMFAALTYQVTERDTDEDGLLDKVDKCPTEPEDFDQFEDEDGCPDVDNDNDSLVDANDTCPNAPEDFDQFEDEDGCPETDNDQDGVLDTEDQCPMVPGVVELAGCPDRDGDGIGDADDVCPDTPGLVEFQGCTDRDGDKVPEPRDECPDDPIPEGINPADSNGCPQLAYLTNGRITIFEKVRFKTGKATIEPESYGLLDAVVQVFVDNDAVRKVEVAGHTDNVGSERYNRGLSDRRAKAVRDYLVQQGIAKDRVIGKGYGEESPITTNRTDEGKAKNRRVEFVILEQDEPAVDVVPAPTSAPIEGLWDTPPELQGSEQPSTNPPATGTPNSIWDTPPESVDDVNPPASPTPPSGTAPAPTGTAPAGLWDAPVVPPSTEPVVSPATVAPTSDPAPSLWDAPTEPASTEPAPARVEPTPSTAAPLWDAPVETDVATPAVPPDVAPEMTVDPTGAPGRLTVELLGGIRSATVYLDNEPLPRRAPFANFPIPAGEHRIWVRDDSGRIDVEQTIEFGNEQNITLQLPEGAEPTVEPEPAPAPQRRGRRSRKR